VATTWFYQDDARKGRASVTSVGTQTFWDSFDELNPLAWTFTHSNTQQMSERFGGDPAFKSTNSNPDWMVQLARQGYTLQDGDAVLVQFRVATTDTHALLAIDSGTWGQPDYRRWGINARDGAVYVSVYTAEGEKEDRVLLSPFKVDTWHVLQLVADDDDEFLMRTWERNEPGVLGGYEDTAGDMPDGRQWRFLQMTWDGTVWLDSYSEGRLYNETVTSYATNERPSSGEIPCEKGACGDLKILWTRPVSEQAIVYEGDAGSVARRIEYRYEEADQGGKQYGNVTHVIEKSWDGAEFVPYRATWTKYYPTATSDTYLVGLAGFSNQYACRQGTCDYTNATLLASSLNLYDSHTQFDLPPSAGILTGQRTLLRFAGANQTDPRYSDVTYAYDDWGNLIETTTYSGEGSELALASEGARAATSEYDDIYHTYALTTTNALEQSLMTAFDYALGVPVAETDANGATTTADYDEFGRLTEIRRPGDETGEATVSITYHDAEQPFWLDIRQKIDDDTIFDLRRIYDGIGQVIQVQTAGAQLNVGLKDIVVDSVYDAYGRVIQQTVPYHTDLHTETPLETGVTSRVSVSSSGSQGIGGSTGPSISADGRYIAFTSQAGNLVYGDTNNTDDVFVHDRWTGQITRISVASDGAQGDGPSSGTSISADGRFVAFKSYARNLVIGDTNNVADVFVHDRQTRQTTRVSVASGGAQGNELSIKPSLSADGRYVAFESWASNLVTGDTNNKEDIFVHDRSTGTTTRVSVASDGTQGNDESDVPFISADGRYVVFSSTASNLVVGDNNVTCDTDGDGQYDDNCPDIYVHDRDTGQTERVSVASDGSQGNGWSVGASISADGRYVAFATQSSLVSDDTNGLFDVYVRDRQAGQTTRVSVAADGVQAEGESRWPSVSADGRHVAFYSSAGNLVSGDTNGAEDIFVHDLQTGQISRVSLASDGAQGNAGSKEPSLSGDGRYVAFYSSASNLVSGDTNGVDDVFVHDRTPLSGIYLGQQLDQPSTLSDYDILGRPITVTATDGSQQHFAYAELETVATDAVGRDTRTLLDVWGRTVQVIPPAGPSVTYTYDALDRLETLEKNGYLTTIAYDLAGRKAEMTDPDMGRWSYAYDAIGNLVRQTDALEKTLWFGYDLLNRLIEKRLNGPDGTLLTSYDYDQGTNGIGRRTRMDDLSGYTTWAYDARGRVVTETKSIFDAGAFVTQWGYDQAGQVVWMKYPGGNNGEAGEQVNFTYHPQQALNSVTSSLGSYVQGTTYDAPGRIIARTLGAGVLESNYAYYPWTTPAGQGRLRQMTAGTPAAPGSLQDLRYDYDLVGNVKTIEDWRAGSPQTQAYTYDALDRLISSSVTGGSGGLYGESYTYDPVTGNLASKGGVNYGYLGGKPHAVTHLDGVQRYWYDANGNMVIRQTGVTSETLVHDAENRLTAVAPITAASASAVFVYDGDGNRVKATVNDVTTAYVGNYYEVEATTTRAYYYAGAQRVAIRVQGDPDPADNGVFFLLGDHLGSTSVTANASGAKVAELRYKAFGETRYEWGSTPTTYRYTGQRQEAALGLYYYGARWYDPALGRFIQADTIVPGVGNPQAIDRYAYVYHNPLGYRDPSGHVIIQAPLADGTHGGGYAAWNYKQVRTQSNPSPKQQLKRGDIYKTKQPALLGPRGDSGPSSRRPTPPSSLPPVSVPDAEFVSFSFTGGGGFWFLTGSIDIVTTEDEIGIFFSKKIGQPRTGSTRTMDPSFVTPQVGVSGIYGSLWGDSLHVSVKDAYEGPFVYGGGSLGIATAEVLSSVDPQYGIPDFNVTGIGGGFSAGPTPAEIHAFYTSASYLSLPSSILTSIRSWLWSLGD